jgi:superfamily II DNA or RNA helicase
MKAILSNRIYLNVTDVQRDLIDQELTYTIPTYNPLDPPLVIKNMARVRKELVTIPSGREDLIDGDYEIIDKRLNIPVEFPKFRYDLRPSQEEVYQKVDDSCIINAWVSWGKTFTALAIAAKLKQKTLVVVHTLALRSQWEKEVEKVFGIKPSIIGSGKFNLEGPIVIGNVQTLTRRVPEIASEFGTIILDEMHHVSSPTFAKIIDKCRARYKIGLSGTIERKDGKHVVFRDYFSPKVYFPPKENYMKPQVDRVNSEIRFLDGGGTPWAKKINHLAYNDEYQHTVAMIASAYAAKGHKVLVVADRVEFLKNCASLSGDNAIVITGETPHEERPAMMERINTDKDILYGTQSIFSEGISLDALSCLVLGTPVNNEPLLTQLIGRIIRLKEGKKTPTIVDINLKGNTARKQANNRSGYYIKQGYKIQNI